MTDGLRTTITEEATDELRRIFRGEGHANVAKLIAKLEAFEQYRTDVPSASGILITDEELMALIGVAIAAKKVLELRVPTGVLLTRQWMALIGASDRIALEEAQPRSIETPDVDCPHDDAMLHGNFRRNGVECSGCGAFASERRIFEETLLEDGSIPSGEEARQRRTAAIRTVMNKPVQ